MELSITESHTNRFDGSDDDHLISPTVDSHSTKIKSISCFKRFQNIICCNRVHASGIYKDEIGGCNDSEFSRQNSFSLSSKTMESVNNAIEGKISVSKAKLHRYLKTINWGPKKGFAQYDIWNFPMELFNDYGVGTKLFFEFLTKSSWLFFIFFLVYIPIYIMLYSAGEFAHTSSFEQFSLGNLGEFNSTSLVTTSFNIPFVSSWSYREINKYIAYTDFCCILLLILFIVRFQATLKKKEKEYDDMTNTVGDFSIEINNLPINTSSRRILANFFQEKWGEIMDVSICYNDGFIVKMYQEHKLIIDDFCKSKILYSKATKASTRAKETSKLQKLQTKLDESTLHMRKVAERFNDGYKQCVKAYVTFENEPERNNCLREYNRRQLKYICQSNPRFVFETKPLNISKAPEPSNIIFLNYGYTKSQLFFRRTFTFIFSTLIIIISFGLIFSAQWAAKITKIHTDECHDITVTESDASVTDATANTINCFCVSIGLIAAFSNNLCKSYINSYIISQSFTISSSLIIVIVNFILKVAIYKLVDVEKHTTASAHQSALAFKIFLSQFMNTAFTILIINCDLNSIVNIIDHSNTSDYNIINGEYSIDFTSEWSQHIGNAIIITMIMGTLNPHLVPVVLMKWKKKQRQKAILNVNSQYELNKAWEGEDFTLADRFGDISAKICVVLLYTPLLPLLWVIMLITFILTYWFNKIFFLRTAAIPPKYDTSLAHVLVTFIKIGISLHLIMCIWVYGSEYRDPEYLNYHNYITINHDYLLKRIFNMNSLPFVILFILLHLSNILTKIIKYIASFFCATYIIEDEAELLPFSQEYVQSENSMELYLLSEQERLKNAFGPDLLPEENVLNISKLEKVEIEYKKQLAKDMIAELMNYDVDEEGKKELNLNISPEFWSIREVGVWLEKLTVGKKYMYQFMFKKVNGQRLLNVTDRFLEDQIEIKNIVHRNQILKSVRKLRIKCGLDKSLKKKKITKEERKQLEIDEFNNYTRHLDLTQKYVQFANEYKEELLQQKSIPIKEE